MSGVLPTLVEQRGLTMIKDKKLKEAYGWANDYWHDIANADERKKAFTDWLMENDKRLQDAYDWYKGYSKDALHELVVEYLDEHFVPDDMFIGFEILKSPDWDSDDPFNGVSVNHVMEKGTNKILFTSDGAKEAEEWMEDHQTWTDETYDLWYKDAKRAVNEIGYYQFSDEEDEEEVDESLKDKKLKETAEGKDELDLYLNNEEWAYRRLEKIVNDGIAKKWSKRAITFGVAREIYNLKDAFGRLPTNRQERLEIANDFVEALLPDDYMEESLKEEGALNKGIFSRYADELKKAHGRDADRLYRKIKADKHIDKIQLQGLTDIYAANRNLDLEESSKEERITPEEIDAFVYAYGTTKKEAKEKLKGFSKEARQEIVKGWKQDAKKSFYEESLKESPQKTIYSWYKRTYPDDYQVEDIVKDVTFEQAKEVMDKGKSLNSLLGKNLDTHVIDRIATEVERRFGKGVKEIKEDIDAVVPEEDNAPVLSASTLPVANKLIEAINGEWDTIVLYNNIITELKENNFDDIIPVIQDIVKEENTHVGQLQKALSTISPDTNDIASGEVEAEGQLNESLCECDGCEYSDDFDTDDEHELYRTDSREIPYDRDQKRLRDRQLVDRDKESIHHTVREETECQCVDIGNEDRVNEREIRVALEDGTLTKDDIVEYTLTHTPDEMLLGMLGMKTDTQNTRDELSDASDDLDDDEVMVCMDDICASQKVSDDIDIDAVDLEMGDDFRTTESIDPDTIVTDMEIQNAGKDLMKDVEKKFLPEATDEHVDGCYCQEDDLDENAVNMI